MAVRVMDGSKRRKADRIGIIRALLDDERIKDITERFGVSRTTVYSINETATDEEIAEAKER